MADHANLWRLFERLISFVPSEPDQRRHPASLPDPNEPGISAETRQARLRLLLQIHEKKSRGGGR